MGMTAEEVRSRIAVLQRQAGAERRLAAEAASAAASQLALAGLAAPGDARRTAHAAAAVVRREAEALHLTAAGIAGLRAGQLAGWLRDASPKSRQPRMIDAIAEALGTPSVSGVLWFGEGQWARLSASDAAGQAACEAEILAGQGPATEAWRTGRHCAAARTGAADRWPLYAQVTAGLSAGAVVAAPVGLPGDLLGAICAYYREPGISEAAVTRTSRTAAAITRLLLHQPGNVGELLARDIDLTVVHQAVGLVAVQASCDTRQAHSLLMARAFADGLSLAEAAAAVLRGQTRPGPAEPGGREDPAG